MFTDYKNLEYFTTMKILNKKQVQWAEELAEYNFIIIYHTGVLNTKADLLSCRADYFLKGEKTMIAKLLLLYSEQ